MTFGKRNYPASGEHQKETDSIMEIDETGNQTRLPFTINLSEREAVHLQRIGLQTLLLQAIGGTKKVFDPPPQHFATPPTNDNSIQQPQ